MNRHLWKFGGMFDHSHHRGSQKDYHLPSRADWLHQMIIERGQCFGVSEINVDKCAV